MRLEPPRGLRRHLVASLLGGIAVGVWAPPSARGAEAFVFDAMTRAPVPGAIVRLKASHRSAPCGPDGRFSFDPPLPHGSTIVAAAVGYYNEGVVWFGQPLEVELESVPFAPDGPLGLIAPRECAACHPIQTEEWEGSSMAHSGRNTWVYDLFNGSGSAGGAGGFTYARDSRLRAQDPDSQCAACHAPELWIDSPGIGLGNYGALTTEARRGVSCGICHTMSSIDTTRADYPGFVQEVARLHRGPIVRFGVLGDVDYHAPGRMRASYQPQIRADLCSACHQGRSDPSHDGRFVGHVDQSTYAEWRASPYARPDSAHAATCIDCHSAASRLKEACADGDDVERPFGQLRTHQFAGAAPAHQGEAAELSVHAHQRDRSLVVEVRVRNVGAGHHLPTGIAMRNVLLVVQVADEGGAQLPQTEGPRLGPLAGTSSPEAGGFAGLPGRLFARVDTDEAGQGPVFFTEAVSVKSDTRLPALGEDVSTYVFSLPDSATQVQLEARLIYRRSWPALIDDKGWTTDGHGRPLEDLTAPHFGRLLMRDGSSLSVEATPSSCTTAGGATDAVVLILLGAARARRRRRGPGSPAVPD